MMLVLDFYGEIVQGKKIPKMFNELVRKDVYGIRRFSPDRFETVIDIGVYLGVSTVFMRFLFPDARIIAVEPLPSDSTIQNLEGLDIELHQFPIGDGSVMGKYFYGARRVYLTANELEGTDIDIQETAKSRLFRDIWVDVKKPVFLKMDCEGGERFICTDENIDLLNQCDYIALELHPLGASKRYLSSFPTRQEYEDFFRKLDFKTIEYSTRRSQCIVKLFK